jgi:multidrug efflux pump
MNLPELCISRPVATTLLTIGITLAGAFAYTKLPVSPLPQVDIPTVSVSASLPGASPDTVASSVAAPLERYLGRIADVTEMTSSSSTGQTRITLQFDLNRDIDGAARDVQAAINAAQADLSTSLPTNPTYRKINPADAPILVLALTSETLSRGQLYDAASNVLQQRLSQLDGVGQVQISGAALPAVRVELNGQAMFRYGIGLEDVRAALASANANSPKGALEDGGRRFQVYTNDQASHAADYQPLVIAWRNGAAVRLTDIAEVSDSVQDLRNAGFSNGKPAILVVISRQPGANIIETVQRVEAELPRLEAALPKSISITVAADRSQTIRASLNDTKWTLALAVVLVTLVVFAALQNPRAAIIPAVVVPVSIIGTFGGMYLLGFSLNNLSLMALTIATGFVVDDAIVVLENITRYVEKGMSPGEAARTGAREIAFTVLSITVSLIAVFIPILLMGGIPGRLFREFAMTLTLAIVISLAISLTTTPMMCALLLKPLGADGRPPRRSLLDRALGGYRRSLGWALRHGWVIMVAWLVTIVLNVVLYVMIPKGFFPQEDSGQLYGGIVADQAISFQRMRGKLEELVHIVQEDPAVAASVGSTGSGSGGGIGQTNTGTVYVMLKPLAERKISADRVIARMRGKLSSVPGGRLFLQSAQDLRVGGRQSNTQYQFTLLGETSAELYEWAPKLLAALQKSPALADVNSDQQQKGLESDVTIDRATAARLGINPSEIDNTLYDAFGQRQVSTIYSTLNQYHVVMELAPRDWQSPATLSNVYISTVGGSASATAATNAIGSTFAAHASARASGGAAAGSAAALASASAENAAINAIANSGRGVTSSGAAVSTALEPMVPLAAIAHVGPGSTPLAVNHQGLFVATTISYNLPPGKALSDADAAIRQAIADIRMPATVRGTSAGTAQLFQQSFATLPLLFLTAFLAVYLVLGMLYESFLHPVTILSTLPPAGIGALIGLILFNTEFTLIAAIGVILLIGIVKKNAIMMIDFALQAERSQGLEPHEAITQACLLRFRPIMMTTLAAILGAVPLTLALGTGSELRQPLGISIVGGLILSQVLTLYSTPVIYLGLERARLWTQQGWRRLTGTSPFTATEQHS